MITTIVASFLLLGKQGGWTTYQSSAGKYSVDFPGKVQTKVQPVNTAVGTLNMNMAFVDQGPKAFMCIYNDYPKAGNPDQVLEGAFGGQTGSRPGLKVVSKRKTTIQGQPAIEAEFSYGTGGQATSTISRLIVRGKRLYQQMAISVGGTIDRAAADRFFKSFKLQ
jgi:hypothetical protein